MLPSLPKVTAICCTYGRPRKCLHLLGEAVYSFLIQDYPNKDLIIFNDAPNQELICNQPNVWVVNCKTRYKTLGEKYNAAIERASGEIIICNEDDDLSLPHRISLSVEKLGDADYYNPQYQWYLEDTALYKTHHQGVCHNASIFRKSAWKQVGGYPEVSGNQDALMDSKLKAQCQSSFDPLTNPEDWFYIYRFGVSPNHLSGFHNPQEYYDSYTPDKLQSGTFVIHPMWLNSYQQMVYDNLKNDLVKIKKE